MNRWHARIWAEDCALTRVLTPLAALYGAITGARMMRPPVGRVGIPVIAVGNYTVGGAGKTPTVDHIVRLTREAGLAPFVVTRGYGGRERGPIRVDPVRHGAGDVGDEALLHARVAPTIVARDRLAGAREAERMGANLVILDDGFQNPRLGKDLSLVVVDRASGLGNARVMPAGPLRAPLEVQFARTDALIVVDNGEGTHPTTEGLIAGAAEAGIPVLTARLAARNPDAVKGRRVVGFAGIGRPAKFAATLEACGALVADFVAFPDHHVFTGEEAADLIRRATAVDGDLATTAKDAVRLTRGQGPLARLAAKIRVVEIGLVFDDEMRLAHLIAAALGPAGSPGR